MASRAIRPSPRPTSRLSNAGILVAVASIIAFGWVLAAPVAAQETATVAIGGSTAPSVVEGPSAPCSDAILVQVMDGVVTFTRDGDAATPMTVNFDTGGSAVEGADYTVSPEGGQVEFPAGESAVDVRFSPLGRDVDGRTIVVSIVDDAGYDVGSPESVTLTIERSTVNQGCEPPSFTAAPSNTHQDISVGDHMAALEVDPFPGTTAHFVVDGGTLPPGITLNTDGSFAGTATRAGTYTATVAACSPAFVPPENRTFCTSTELSVVVHPLDEAPSTPPTTGPRPPTLPATGASNGVLVGVGLVAVGAGYLMTRASARRVVGR